MGRVGPNGPVLDAGRPRRTGRAVITAALRRLVSELKVGKGKRRVA